MGKRPQSASMPPAITKQQFATLPGLYHHAESGEVVEVKATAGKLYLMGEGVPLQIRPKADDAFVIDGRIYGRGADYPHMNLSFPKAGGLNWKGQHWSKVASLPAEQVPPEIAVHLGEYGPDFNITYLTYSHGQLKCLIEYFCTHGCEPIDGGRFRMRGLLYEEEILELGAVDEHGRQGIRVGPMFLERRKAAKAA
jgi:D-alanyl-D-alanine dipeptidase